MDLVTGAAGFLGSHIVERLLRAGRPVRVLVRSTSDTRFLDRLPVERVTGDLTDKAAALRACEGVETVYHAAAKVRDWGSWREFHKNTVEATANLADAARRAAVRRFLYVSSVSVYGSPKEKEGTPDAVCDETCPIGVHVQGWNLYGRAKAEAEQMLWRLRREEGFPLTVIRPAWIYGPRDGTSSPRIYRLLQDGAVRIVGDGDNRLSVVYAPDAADACLLAASNEGAVGEAYNCANDDLITQRQFLSLWADALGLARPTRTIPYPLAFWAASWCERAGRLFGRRAAPSFTRYSIWVLGRRVYFRADKARRQLGWRPALSYREGIARAARWYLEQLWTPVADSTGCRSR